MLDAHVPAPRGLQADASTRDPLVFRAPPRVLDDALVQRASALLAAARRPLILAGPVMSNGRASDIREELTNALGIPALCMESPRGLNDPALGALAEVVSRADLVVLLGKRTDFTLRFAQAPAFAESCRFVVIDPEASALERTLEVIGPARMALSAIADTVPAARQLCAAASVGLHDENWKNEVESAVRYRPPEWSQLDSGDGPVHPAEVGRAVQHFLQTCREPLFVSDGGEFGQWAQACIDAPTRIINGPAGSIGSAIPFALAASLRGPRRPSSRPPAMARAGFICSNWKQPCVRDSRRLSWLATMHAGMRSTRSRYAPMEKPGRDIRSFRPHVTIGLPLRSVLMASSSHARAISGRRSSGRALPVVLRC